MFVESSCPSFRPTEQVVVFSCILRHAFVWCEHFPWNLLYHILLVIILLQWNAPIPTPVRFPQEFYFSTNWILSVLSLKILSSCFDQDTLEMSSSTWSTCSYSTARLITCWLDSLQTSKWRNLVLNAFEDVWWSMGFACTLREIIAICFNNIFPQIKIYWHLIAWVCQLSGFLVFIVRICWKLLRDFLMILRLDLEIRQLTWMNR